MYTCLVVTVGMETATYTWNEPQQAIACAEIMASGVQSLERSVAVIVVLSDETAYGKSHWDKVELQGVCNINMAKVLSSAA